MYVLLQNKQALQLGESKLQFEHQDMRTIKIMRKNVKKKSMQIGLNAKQTCTKNKGIRPTIHF